MDPAAHITDLRVDVARQGRVLGECTCPRSSSAPCPSSTPLRATSAGSTRPTSATTWRSPGSRTPRPCSPGSSRTGPSTGSCTPWSGTGRSMTQGRSGSSTGRRCTPGAPGRSSRRTTWSGCVRRRRTTAGGVRRSRERRDTSTGWSPTTTGWGTDPLGVAPPRRVERGKGYPYIPARALRAGREMFCAQATLRCARQLGLSRILPTRARDCTCPQGRLGCANPGVPLSRPNSTG